MKKYFIALAILINASLFGQDESEKWFLLGFGDNDTIPNSFNFTDQTNLALSTEYTSDSIVVSGIDGDRTTIYAGGASYRKGVYGSWATAYGTVVRGDTIWLKVTSSTQYLTTVNTTLTIGSISNIWSITTALPADSSGYWVATNGNDSWAGNFSYPFLTLTQAKTVATGSVVNIEAGTYKETSILNIGNGIEFVGHGTVIVQNTSTYAVQTSGATTKIFRNIIFDAEGSLSYVAHANGGVTKYYGCTFKNSTSYNLFVANTNDSVIVDGCTFIDTVANYMMSLRDRATITNCTMAGDLNTALVQIASVTDSVVFSNNNVNVKFPQGFIPSSNALIYIQNNTFTIPQNITNLFDDGVQTAGSISITGNTITTAFTSSDDLITIAGSSGIIATVSNNIFSITSASFTKKLIYLANLECAVSGNTITTSSETNTSPKINVVSTGTDIDGKVDILNNTIYDRSKGGYSIAIGTENTGVGDNLIDGAIVTGNTIYGLGYYRESSYDSLTIHSMMIGFNRNAVITQNKVYGSGYGVVLKGSVTAYTSGGVYYNLFINCLQGIRAKAVQGLNVYNNTIYNNLNYAFICIYLTENTGGDGSTITTIKNNIAVTGSTELDYCVWADATSAVGLVSDYNLLINTVGDVGRLNATEYDFAEWQTATYDTHGLNVNPEFVSASDFSLQVTSDAINAGIDVSLTTDILGNPISGNPDMGCYEYQP